MKYGRSVSDSQTDTDKDESSTYSINIDERPAECSSLTETADFGFHERTDRPAAIYLFLTACKLQ